MEHTYPVSCDAHPAAQRISSAHTAPHASPHAYSWASSGTPSAFVEQMEELLGEHTEPDSQFFVESWTLGVEAAERRFQARREAAANHDFHSPTFRTFDFSVPLNFVADEAREKQAVPSMPAAWREAYGVRETPGARNSSLPYDEARSNAPIPGQPLTLESACRLLGVATDSTRKQIKAAYRQLVWRYHPDRLAQSSEQERRFATDRMISINEAYHLLCGAGLAAAS